MLTRDWFSITSHLWSMLYIGVVNRVHKINHLGNKTTWLNPLIYSLIEKYTLAKYIECITDWERAQI
jgi:hypothetical protein